MLIAMTTSRSATVRKLIRYWVKLLKISPSALRARPFSTRSQDLPFVDLQMPAAMVQAPAASASLPRNTTVPCTAYLRTVRDPSGSCVTKYTTENIASRTPHNARNHQFLISVWIKVHLPDRDLVLTTIAHLFGDRFPNAVGPLLIPVGLIWFSLESQK